MRRRIKDFLYDNEDSATKAGFYYLICQLVVRGLGFLASPIFTRMMTKSEFGMVSNFMAWEAILFPVLSLNLRSSINKSRYDFPDDNDSYLGSILLFSQVFISILIVSTFAIGDLFAEFTNMELSYVRLLLVYLMFYVAFDYQQIQYNIFKKYKIYVLYSILSSIFSLVLSVVLVVFMNEKTLGRILGIIIPAVMIYTFIELDIFHRSQKMSWRYIKYGLAISIPLLPSALSANILSTMDRTIIAGNCTMDDVAMYSVAYTIAGIAAVVWTAFNQAWSPWLMDNLNVKAYGKIRNTSKYVGAVYAFIIIGLMLIAPEILYIMGGQPYMEAIIAMPPVILAMICQFYYAYYFNVEYFYGETYIISFGTMLAALLNFVLNIIFIPRYGYVAAAYTTLVGYALMLLYHYMIVRIKLKKSFIYDNSFIFKLLILIAIVQCGIFQMYSNPFVRYVVILIYIVIISGLIYHYRNVVILYGRKIFK